MMERQFRDITIERLHRGVFVGVPALAASLDEHIAHPNTNTKPKPRIWVERVSALQQKAIRTSSRLSFEPNATRHGPVRKTGRRCRTGHEAGASRSRATGPGRSADRQVQPDLTAAWP